MDKEVETLSSANIQSIKAINQESVHKICSGQVVLSLAVAVKELVENSLDAGATIIDVRLKNYGIDLIEVSDNGSGVTEHNFAALTLKHHTSKLSEYSDLLGVTSFGFRGEALSSLCALSTLVITTRHKTADYAMKIEYNQNGHILKKTPCSRQIGTTVSLSNLFSTLPVRQKEFYKNAKREFNKMTQLLYAYCLISLGVKITCQNQTTGNHKSLVVATQGSTSYKDNIACVFGIKQLQSILQIKQDFTPNIKDNIFKGLSNGIPDSQESLVLDDVEINLSEDSNDTEETDSIPNSQKSQGYKNVVSPVDFTGFISSCEHGSGRSSADRQFYYVNSRPCEPVKVIKLINETYKQFNPHQYPFIFLNVTIDRTNVDVNVTPDKRKVFLTKEKIILDILRSSLHKLFESIPRTLKVEHSSGVLGQISHNDVKPDVDQPRIFNSFIQKFANNNCVTNVNKTKEINHTELKRKSTTMLDFVSAKKTIKSNDSNRSNESNSEIIDDNFKTSSNISNESLNEYETVIDTKPVILQEDICIDEYNLEENIRLHEEIKTNNDVDKQDIMILGHTDALLNTQIRTVQDIEEKSHTIYCKTKNTPSKPKLSERVRSPKNPKILTDVEDLRKYDRRTVTMKTSLEHVKALVDIYNQQESKQAPKKVKFRSAINPVFNKNCEEELSREISKDSFKQMKVLGQFNLGFIITRLDDDLFIIDQHATDEIYNFEMLQKTTELTSQKLVIPQQLELTGVNEQILMDNLEVFKKNGFTFEIDEYALPTKRVKLLTIPMSKNWVFGKEDIEELLFMLREGAGDGNLCRPSRVRSMFASRACRRSVMVGAALALSHMTTLVRHMADIDRPWNCPHGRPTIRHLVNLAMVHVETS